MEFETFVPDRDYKNQRELFALSFPETVGTAACSDEHYRWKFRHFQQAIAAHEYVAFENQDCLLGYYAAIPFNYSFAERKYVAAMVCDVMTHPQARGKGIFTKIGRHATSDLANKGFDFCIGYPIRPEVIPGHLKVGWTVAFKLPMFVKVVSVPSFAGRWTKRLKSLLDPLIHFLNFAISSVPRASVTSDWSREDFFKNFDYKAFYRTLEFSSEFEAFDF